MHDVRETRFTDLLLELFGIRPMRNDLVNVRMVIADEFGYIDIEYR